MMTHDAFFAVLDRDMPTCRMLRADLNVLPLADLRALCVQELRQHAPCLVRCNDGIGNGHLPL